MFNVIMSFNTSFIAFLAVVYFLIFSLFLGDRSFLYHLPIH